MRTLIVSSYHGDWTPKAEPVREMVHEFSDCDMVLDTRVSPDTDLKGYDAVVLTGSPNLVSRSQLELPFLQFLRRLDLPTLGICYGHQMLAHAFGARVFEGARFIEGYDTVRVLEPEPLFHGLDEEIVVMESHREHVDFDDLDRTGFELLANSTTCDVEAIRHIERPLFGVQFHIERS
jgi:GMP synthase (glutamine-hydrolysing)